MARVYLDEDVYLELRDRLADYGHDVVLARHITPVGAPDAAQLLAAAHDSRILITHNEGHFAVLNGAWILWPPAWQVNPPPRHLGIFCIPHKRFLLPEVSVQKVDERLHGSATLTNTISKLTRGGIWRTLVRSSVS